jgi:orotidine-5'-phosphate decarboxylase
MITRNFTQLVQAKWNQGFFLCVGLDPDYAKIPGHLKKADTSPGETVFAFNKAIIDATKDYTATFKPQSSFYEALGGEGMEALRRTIAYIHEVAPDMPVLLDAKRADIGSTNEAYVQAIYDHLQADAVTLQPYLGGKSLKPFLENPNHGAVILCRTSNPGSGEFQDLIVESSHIPLYQHMAVEIAHHWNEHGNCWLVVGATYPEEMRNLRHLVDLPFLIPGIGAQGGDLEAVLKAGLDKNKQGLLISSSRGIIFASSGEDFAERAGTEAKTLHDTISRYRNIL